MDTKNRWKPNDWIRLVALIGAFVLFGLGAWMLFQGISAEGEVDLKSSILSGTIKASSAGLYMCFFALFIILTILATLIVPSTGSTTGTEPRVYRLMPIFRLLLASLTLCAIGSALTEEGARMGFTVAIAVISMALLPLITAMVRMTADGNN